MDKQGLEKRLGHKFNDHSLLRRALTHASASEARNSLNSYQRLEFLGDRVLGLSMAEILYKRFPHAEEGELSQRLTGLVRKEACAKAAQDIQLGSYIVLGSGEAQSGGRQKPAILADVMEALLGAIFLEAGFEAVKQVVENLWSEQLNGDFGPLRDNKTALQEWAHRKGFGNPSYHVVDRDGPDHSPTFTVEVCAGDDHMARGTGPSKRDAEQNAAKSMLIQYQNENIETVEGPAYNVLSR